MKLPEGTLSVKDAMDYLGTTRNTLYVWSKKGILRHIKQNLVKYITIKKILTIIIILSNMKRGYYHGIQKIM